ncbi:MAG: hypothetical protein JWN34_2316 [Bryobacterales bacterium]|jgi:hypothetical protein|nr:hypothetical protein [Bryobacterales bacterium]
MNTTNDDNFDQPRTNRSTAAWPVILGVGFLGLCGAAVYQNMQTQDLRRELVAARQESTTLRNQLTTSGSDVANELRAVKESISQELDSTKTNVDRFRATAIKHADTLARKQTEQSQQLAAQLGAVKESNAVAANRIDGIATEFGTAKTDINATKTELAGTKTDLDATKSDLQRVRGDMGMMSGLVATNSKDIQFLRELGDRNIYEFTIDKKSGMQKVGDIQIALRKADVKRNRFTVDVLADDKTVQKRDKTTNEPVQFYTSKSRQVYEVVVNRVDKDRIVGYLATPKVSVTRAAN